MSILAMGSVSVIDVADGNGVVSVEITYAIGSSPTVPPGQPLTNNGVIITDMNGLPMTDATWQTTIPTVPKGKYLWTRTITTYANGDFSIAYVVGYAGTDGATGAAGATITASKEQWYLSNSSSSLTGGSWLNTEPTDIPDGKYLWGRWQFTMSDGTTKYSDAVYRSVIGGVISVADAAEKAIRQKVWSSDITNSINQYDNTTGASIRDRVTATETDLSGIHTTISNVQTTLANKADGSTVTALTTRVQNVEDTADSHTRQISATNTRIDNIKLGTKNYIQNSETLDITKDPYKSSAATATGASYVKDGQPAYDASSTKKLIVTFPTLISGREYVFSYDWNRPYDTQTLRTTIGGTNYDVTTTNDSVWHRQNIVFTANANTTQAEIFFVASSQKIIYARHFQLELGNIPSDWHESPEDVEAEISSVRTIAEQTSDRFSWIVQDGSTSSSVQYTANALTAMANQIDLTGKVTFNSFDTDTQNALTSDTELIIGTQTSSTSAWTGKSNKLKSIAAGTRISYKLPYASTSTAVTLNLTLSNGSTTGAKEVYYLNTTRLNTQYGVNSIIQLIYDGSVWRVLNPYSDANTYDRTRYQQAIKAGSTAIVAGNIIVAGANNAGTYTHLKLGNAFDTSYPILYAASAISANGTGTNNYLIIPLTLTTTQSGTYTAYKSVYIKGTLSGTTFTPVSTTPLTQTIPTSADNYHYILLGTMYSTTEMYLLGEHPIFMYYKDGFKTTSQIAAEAATKAESAQSTANTASTNASNAVSTANTANTNASNALTKVNGSIKSTTMHYLATSAGSGVTKSTSGWTTTIQTITATNKYLWTYQTITKVDDSTYDTDPVVSGVYGNQGIQGNTGTGVTKVEQLYRTGNSTTAPAAPTDVITSTSTTYNTWTLAMPTYNTSYPYYYTCTQTTYSNGSHTWTTVARSSAIEDANKTANTANTNASNAVTTANTANTNASNAVTTANTANTNASNAVTTANTANGTANTALNGLKAFTGTSNTATGTAAKVVSCSDNTFALTNGVTITITFSTANTADAPTLNVNSLGAKAIYFDNAVTSSNNRFHWQAGSVITFQYNGTYWVVLNYDNLEYFTSSTAAGTAAKVNASVTGTFVLCKGTTINVYFSTANTAAAPTLNIGATGAYAVYYKNAVTSSSNQFTWDAGATLTFTYNGSYWYVNDGGSLLVKNYAKTAVDWVGTNGSTVVTAAGIMKTWTGDATLATTTINGGYIKTHTIESTHLATNAIMSQNYTGLDNSHFSSEGSYLDLSTGNFYTPKFGVSAEGQGGAYINGEVVATSGRFGNDTSYWNIATVYDYNSQPHASLVGTGSPYLQTGNWQVSDNAVATRKYTSTSESAGNATYYKDSDTNTFYDVGMKIPTDFSSTAATNDVGRYNKAFYYGRKYTGNNPPTVEGNWVYFYMLDTSGNLKTAGTITTGGDIYEGGTKLSEKYAAISDVGSVYLPKTGGTITGNLTVNGSFTTNLQLQTNLGSTSSAQLTGAANAVVKPGVTGTLGVGNGGTGKSSWTANQIVYASASNTLSQLGSGTSGQILKSNGSSAPSWVNQSALSVGSATKATQDGNGNVIVNTYMPIAGGQFTGAVYVPDEFSADSAQLGSLIVNGAARFTNDVFADTFTGNLVGTASNAVKVGNNLVIKLNGGSTEGTNLFTYNGSAAKTINITASSIGAQASGTYAGGISNGGAASKLAYQSGNEINFVSTADTHPTSMYFNYRNGYTGSKTGVSADYAYYFDNGNAEYNRTTLYAAQFSGNAATATTATTADKVGNNLVILFNSGSTEGTNKFTYNGSAAKNVNITKSSIGLGNVENTALSTWAGSANLTTTKVGTLAAAAAKGVDTSISDSSTSANLPTSAAVATFVEGKGYVTSSGVTSITLKAGTGVSLDTDNTAITSTGTRTISLADGYGDTKNPYGTKTKNYVLAGPTTGSAAVPTFRALVADDIPTITPAKAGLGNVTNDKQVKGLSSGTTSGHLVSWGANGYTVADSGIATTSVTTKIKLAGTDYSVSSNTITITQANLQSAVQSTGLVLMTSAERSKLESIQVSEGGTIDFSGVTASSPLTATVSTNKTVNITHNTSGVSAGTYRSVTVNTYGHVTAGTNPTTLSGYGITDAKIASGVITLGSNTITPLTASSTLDATKLSGTASISTTGNATTATKFSSNRSITLTGDVVGTSSSNGENGWSLTTAIVDDSHNHTTETIVPLQTKTYTGVIASANDEAKGQLYFIKVQPDAYGGQWSIHYKVTATIDGVSAANGNGYETSDVYLSGMRDTYSGYRTWNDITNTSYRPYYYHCFYRAKEAGINGGYGHAIGINLRYSYNPTTAANTRTVTFEIIKTEGCTVTLLDAPLIYANWPGTGSTNYNTYNNFDATTQGNTMSGDRNDVNYYNRNYYGSRTAAANIYRYQLCLTKKDRSLLPINSVNNDVSTNKSLTTESFDPFGDILYWSSTTTYSAGANVGDGWYAQYLADIRYSFNIGGYNTTSTLVGRKPLYLVATPQADGTAVLHSSPLAQDLPTTEDGLIYIYLGQVYQDTHPYRLYLTILHPIYWYKNGAVRQYIQTSEKALQDGNGAVIASTYAKLSGATFTGAVNTANGTWNTIGDDAYLGDINKGGHIGIKGKNGNTGLFFVTYNQNSNTTGGAITWDGTKFSITGTVDTSISGNAATAATASTATKWASAQTVYVALGTASKTTSIQGGSSSAVTLGVDGVLGVANGGTGASSFTANSVIMSGSSTTGAFTTRAVTNNTSASAVTANTNLITANTLAYWTGSSNLTTCSKGTFGTAATYSATTSVTSGSSALVTSGGVSTALGSYVTLSTTQTISGTKTFSAATSFTNTTASTSKSTGAVKVSGGLGVAGQVSANTAMIGDAVSLVYDSSISALCFQFA